jgi:hypothetical protein
MNSPIHLTTEAWKRFFDGCQALHLHTAGARLAIELLAHAEGLPSEALETRPQAVHQLSCWQRRKPDAWVQIELVRYDRTGRRFVRYHATPGLHAALGVPPAWAQILHHRVEGWMQIAAAAKLPRPMALLSLLTRIAMAPEAGFEPRRNTLKKQPFLAKDIAWAPVLKRLVAVRLLHSSGSGRHTRYHLAELGRRILALPPAVLAASTPLRTPQPYQNRNAA